MTLHPTLKFILAVLAGIIAGSAINYLLLKIGSYIIPFPGGDAVLSKEGFESAFPSFGPEHFIFPFLAHALGTFTGAYVASRFSGGIFRPALIIGAVFFAGGADMVYRYGGPLVFIIADLVLAYVPMAWLGYRAAQPKT